MVLKGWQDSFSVGVDNMDQDHRKMMQMINSLFEAMKQGQSKSMLSPLISDLYSYATEHCKREEAYLTQIKHPDLETQRQQHALFLQKVLEFQNNFQAGNNSVSVQMLPYLNDWFLNHIMKIDSKYKMVTG